MQRHPLACRTRTLLLLIAFAIGTGNAGAALFGGAPDWPAIKRTIRERHPAVPQLSTSDLKFWLADAARPKPLLLDTRAADEYAVSHLRDAVHAPSIGAAQRLLGERPKDVAIVVYCSVGVRSSLLAEQLIRAGYRNVANLEGSLFEWANRGYPIYRDGQPADRVHPYDRHWGKLLDRRLWAQPSG